MAVTTNSDNMMVDGTDSEPNQNDLMAITTDFDSNSYPNRKGLPLELLSAILKSPHIIDCIGLGNMSVCWCSAAAGILHPHVPQSQFILFDGSNSFVQDRLPQLQNLRKFITGSHLHLLSTFPEVGHHPELDADGNYLYQQFIRGRSFHQALDYFGKSYIWMAFICPRTSAIICLKMHLAFCVPGDQTSTMNCNWSSAQDPRMYEFWDDVFYKDDLYGIVSFKISDDFKYTEFEAFRDSGDVPRMYLVEADVKLLRIRDAVIFYSDLNCLLFPSLSAAETHLSWKDLMVAIMNSSNTMVVATDSDSNWNDSMVNTTDSDSNSYPTWKDLPPELLSCIIELLPIVDNIHFGTVCTDWYLAAARNFHRPAPQPPFLLLASDNTGKSDIFQLFDLSVTKFYKIRIPQLRDCFCIGSSEGKLIFSNSRAELQVLDPITGSHFDLPSITTLPEVGDPELDADGNVTGYLFIGYGPAPRRKAEVCPVSYYNNAFYWKVIICPKTSAVVVLFQQSSHVALCLPGDRTWTIIKPEPYSDNPYPELLEHLRFVEAVFYKDAIWVISHSNTLFSLKIGNGDKLEKVSKVVANITTSKHLVEVDGELLLISRYADYVERGSGYDGDHPYDCFTQAFDMQKLNYSTMRWEIIKSIGEYAMFLGMNSSFSLSTRDYPELKANSIYFTDVEWEQAVLYPQSKRDVGLFNLEDGTFEPCYPGESDWHLTWPPPIWFTPKVAPCRRRTMET